MSRKRMFCDGIQRRDFLQIGSAGLFSFGLSLSDLLQARASGKGDEKRDDVSLIIVFLKGGLSTIDTWDLKPNAPADIRGEFDPISTNVPGIQLGELMPKTAQQMDKFSLIRSFTHPNSSHGHADHYMLTSYHPTAGFNPGLTPNNQQPAIGATIAEKLGPRGSVPPYVCLPTLHPSAGAAYLGAASAPFVINADPNSPSFAVPDLAPSLSLQGKRLNDRKGLLKEVDRFQKSAEASANTSAGTVNVFRQKAFDLMTSPAAKKAFDIQAEPEKLRNKYGRSPLGQGCLMARRLVESGVRCVTVNHIDWDTHYNNFTVLKNELVPHLDAAMSTLFADLSERGMLEKTLVMISGEFGRTPRINKDAGRDHWGPCFSVALAGGGIQGGRIIGKSDEWAQRPATDPHGPENLAATLFHLLNINHKDIFNTPDGRPVPIVKDGKVIRQLL